MVSFSFDFFLKIAKLKNLAKITPNKPHITKNLKALFKVMMDVKD